MKSLLAAVVAGGLLSALNPAAASQAHAAAPRGQVTPVAVNSYASTAGTGLRIMSLGDSITVGNGSSAGDGYRYFLQKYLKATGATFDFVGSQRHGRNGDVDNEGHGGWTIDQIAAQLDGWLSTYQPNVVLLHAGTNNVSWAEAPADIAAKLSAMIDQIHATVPKAQIFVAKIIATRLPNQVATNKAYNALIPGIVADKGPLVHVVDQSTVGGLSIDDAHHPNDFGYRKMAYNWYQAMRDNLAPNWRAPADNPFAQTKHVLLVNYDWAQRRQVKAYWSRVIGFSEDGKKIYVWLKDKNQNP
ncbi:SGNH/GDSL hydrolase family protein [Actinoplanes sp. KI2]|uniref:SGNH/GDSL hydrolase family protein n=1 Tax=Actinoplanes sp. KI2 TaxID=2983315 RepID=UPI0021D5A5B0|nr:SGNH/GDSL hydrolase family protein [Actinoplanes sp. KI2]MCU7722851.1 SGNH/GDSL hydrolase family protein [Actinoplanes sp. KI2]